MIEEKSIGFLINGISLSPDVDENEACSIAATEMKRAGISPARLRFDIYKRSVDARRKDRVRLVYSISVRSKNGEKIEPPIRSRYGITPLYDREIQAESGSEKSPYSPLIVGMGPAGLFCALLLAERGYSPTIIDRGDSIAQRSRAHGRFVQEGILDTESNIQFGAGGAGTYSDGKLLTRVNDPRVAYVLSRFCEFGAPEEIMISAKPHIGTDRLMEVVDRMLSRIEELGGRVLYRCRLDGISEMADGSIVAKTTKGEIHSSALVLAPGHSARDTYAMLMQNGYAIEAKPFSVGVRIEHLQSKIDEALYGSWAGHPRIGRGEYHLSDTTSGRGVYTFCMCPGGQVVAAASEEGGVVVNGMSVYARDGKNANSAVCVSVRPEDYGATPELAIAFQRNLEKAAFLAGGSDYYAPIQTVGDFLQGKQGSEPTTVLPTYRDGRVRCVSMDRILPSFVTEELRRGLHSFDRKLLGFAHSEAVLSGVETRTSAPVRILRDDQMRALGHTNVYPCGEGAGYAGGITSAALDGIRVAERLIERFQPNEKDFC
ncbi:MAG: FAD-dependent monooxygenase [Clostridia bacterium]|nr:FAD-dependent monooxygenase [Clostridia bacterium]